MKMIFALISLGCLINANNMLALDFHVSPSGSPNGSGSLENPIDLDTALAGGLGQPGDTFWLHEGIYSGRFDCALQGQPDLPITVRQAVGERATLDGSISKSSGGYVVYWGFEVMSSYPSHVSAQSGSAPSDLPTIMGMNLRAPGLRLINLVIHDHTSNDHSQFASKMRLAMGHGFVAGWQFRVAWAIVCINRGKFSPLTILEIRADPSSPG